MLKKVVLRVLAKLVKLLVPELPEVAPVRPAEAILPNSRMLRYHVDFEAVAQLLFPTRGHGNHVTVSSVLRIRGP